MAFFGDNVFTIEELDDALREFGISVINVGVKDPCSPCPKIEICGVYSKRQPRKVGNIQPKHIFKNGLYTTVMWSDGTKTIVKRGEDELDDEYTAFTAALAKKLYGSTSAVKRIAEMTKVQSKKYKESSDCAEKDACEIAVENHECEDGKGETLNDLVRKQWEDFLSKGEKK